MMTLSQCIDELVERHGSLRAVARVSGQDIAYLSRLRSGEKTAPGKRVLKSLGIKRIVLYSLRP